MNATKLQTKQTKAPPSTATRLTDGLPHPSDHPDADVVIFDGQCRFCLASVKQLRWFDGRNRLAFVSLHDPLVAERYPDLSHDQMMKEMYLVSRDEQRHAGADSLRYLSRRLPKLWLLMPLMHIPGSMPLWRWLYAFVAKRRYLIAGRLSKNQCDDGTCQVHFEKKS